MGAALARSSLAAWQTVGFHRGWRSAASEARWSHLGDPLHPHTRSRRDEMGRSGTSGRAPSTPNATGGGIRQDSADCSSEVEATTGFEPVNRGFADLRVEPLHHVASGAAGFCHRCAAGPKAGCPSRIRTSPHGFKVRCPTTRRRGTGTRISGRFLTARTRDCAGSRASIARLFGRGVSGQRNGAEDGTRTRDPHLGKVMLYQLSHFRSELRAPVLLVPRARVELATPRFSVACSTN